MFNVPELPFAYDGLEPYIDQQTLEIHHGKHHQAYCAKLNAAIEGTDTANMSLDDIIKNANTLPAAVKNNGGGVWNHTFYWNCLGLEGGEATDELQNAINAAFGSIDGLKEQFLDTASKVFGSGWAWLMKKPDGSLYITTSANQDNPLNDNHDDQPVIVCDVWEHAYYLKYQNRRPEYLENFWNALNWSAISTHYAEGFSFPS